MPDINTIVNINVSSPATVTIPVDSGYKEIWITCDKQYFFTGGGKPAPYFLTWRKV